MIGHELKTPLTGIKTSAQLLKRRGIYQAWLVDAILRGTDRLNQQLDELVLALTLEAGDWPLQVTSVDLGALARAAVSTAQARAAQHQLRVEGPSEPLTAVADAQAVDQVLQRLLSNAVAFSPQGSEVQVRVEERGAEARVAVVDQGTGIPPEALPSIFERFYRVDDPALVGQQGLGLGLYICRLLVSQQGGRLWAESSPGQGSVFIVSLPAAAAQHADGRRKAA